jgi:hypothetical protein
VGLAFFPVFPQESLDFAGVLVPEPFAWALVRTQVQMSVHLVSFLELF